MSREQIVRERSSEALARVGRTPDVPCLLIEYETAETVWSRGPRWDEAWSFRDHAGHVHAYHAAQTGNGEHPTLLRGETVVACDYIEHDDDCEGYTLTIWTCRECGEVIEPGKIHGPYATQIEGRGGWRVITYAGGLDVTGLQPARIVTHDGRTLVGEVVNTEWSIDSLRGAQGTWEGVGELRRVYDASAATIPPTTFHRPSCDGSMPLIEVTAPGDEHRSYQCPRCGATAIILWEGEALD